MRTFVVTTRSGTVSFESPYSDSEALAKLENCTSKFGADLYAKSQSFALSAKQMAWVHKIAVDMSKPPDKLDVKFTGIYAMMILARESGINWPVIRVELDTKLKLTLAGERARYPNAIVVKQDGEYVGRIHTDCRPERMPEAVMATLKELDADPVRVASLYGRKTGRCCFCGHELETAESLTVGYGPICADKYGLPWGAIDPKFTSRYDHGLA